MIDLLDGLSTLRLAFSQANLKPPTVLLLADHHEGMRFLNAIRQTNHWVYLAGSPDLSRVVEMADGSAWKECRVMDIAVRWPANKIAMPDGSWSFV